MNRKAKIIVLLLLILVSICGVAPYLIQTQHIKTALIERISGTVEATTTVEKIRWRWLPLPHVTLYDSHIHNDDFDLNIPKTRIYPTWTTFFSQKVTVGRIFLQKPELSAHPSFFSITGTSSFTLPQASLVIHEGSLKADLPDFKGLKPQTIHFNNTNLNLRNSGDYATFTLQSNSSFADSLKVSGKFLFGNKEFTAKSIVKKFRLDYILSHDTSWLSPLATAVDMELDLIGQGANELRILFSGNIPDFTLQRLDEKAEFHFDAADFVFEKKNDTLKLGLLNLELANPRLQLTGEIEKYLSKDLEEPSYRLDLQSRDINLNDVRSKLLSLLGDTEITRKICDIVRSGQASRASYKFNAPLSAFSHIELMQIEVDVDSANIYVPEVNLNLRQTSGPIQIMNGELSGDGLSTWLGNSLGTNGSFLLGLGDGKWAFKLDVDIDANISDLPGTLRDLIDADLFKEEMARFSGAGRAKAHLLIGDDLRDFSVTVSIDGATDTVIYYDRSPWPIRLRNGSVTVRDNTATWNDVAGTVGPHTINEISGETSWENDSVPTDIQSISATIHTDSLHHELIKHPQLADTIDDHFQSADGFVEINQGTVTGPFFTPQNWNYQLNLAFKDVTFSTPHLPGMIELNTGSALVQPGMIHLKELDGAFLNSPFTISTTLNQKQSKNWDGSLSVTAPLTVAQINWLRTKKWLPEQFLPATPSQLNNFEIVWDEHTIMAKGAVLNKILSGSTAKADFTIHTDTSGSLDAVIDLAHENEQGQLSILKPSSTLPVKIGWRGTVSQPTLSALFAKQYAYSGQLAGDIMITLPIDNTPLAIDGQIMINDLQRGWGEQLRQISVKSLNFKGKGNELFVNDMDLEYQNETAFISGKLLFTPKNVHLDLQQQATTLSEKKLSDFIDGLSDFFAKIEETSGYAAAAKPKASSIITGGINLHADRFLLDTGKKEKDNEHVYALEPLQATVDLSNPYVTTLKIFDSQICSLPLDGTLQWTDIYTQKDFNLALPEGETLFFQEFLPCVGVKKKFIEGTFDVMATITDIDGDLTAGKFILKSSNGTLWRLVFLSKIFQLINFTDLYDGLFSKGFPYTVLDLNAHIDKNLLIFDRAVIEGEGLNLVIQGSVNLKNSETNLIVFIVPFKSIDTIIKNIPFVGKFINRLVGGKKGHIITIPVEVSGNIKDPNVKLMSTKAVGSAAIDFILDTITFPLDILPDLSSENKEAETGAIEGKSGETTSPGEKTDRE